MRPARAPRQFNLYGLLAALPVLGILPLVSFAAVTLYLLWEGQQAEARKDLQQTVRTLAVAVERELAGSIGQLERLAELPLLGSDDGLQAFHAHARRVLARQPAWLNITLNEPDGTQRVNASMPFGESLPRAPRAHHEQVLRTGLPAVSDIYVSRRSEALAIAASVPVLRDGAVRWVLTARLEPAALSRLLRDQRARPGFIASITDRTHRVVARSRDIELYFGQRYTDQLVASLQAAPAGTARLDALDGTPVLAAWQRLDWGWTVSLGVPRSVYDSPLQRSVALLGLIGLGILAAGVLASVAMAQRITHAVHAARDDAMRLAEGGEVASRASRIRQLHELSQSLRQGSLRLRATMAERAALLVAERAARERAEAASRGKDELIAMLGHELRNPLSAIANAARLVDDARLPAPERARMREVLDRQVRHMRRLIDDLLDVSRVLAGKIPLLREPVDLAEVVERALAALRAAGRLSAHELQTDLHAARVDGDPVRLEQVVTNLVGNAAKYTPEGGRIGVALRAEGDQAVLRVADDGIGMDAALLARAFDLFAQGDQDLHRASGGLGLGLTLARRLVQMHGGTLTGQSEGPGRGSVFEVRLPLA